MAKTGTVNLLHFDKPYAGEQHYVRYTANLRRRLHQHRTGRGARLTQRVHAAGIAMRLPRTWIGDLQLEARLHRDGNYVELCALCQLDAQADRTAGTRLQTPDLGVIKEKAGQNRRTAAQGI